MSSKLSVLFIYGRHIGISDKLVGLYQLQYLEKAGRINLNIKAFWNVSYADLAGCDCVYACRLALYSLRWFFRVAKGLGKRIVFGLDDDLLSVPKDVPSHLLYGNRFFKENFEKELALVDVLVSPSKKILAKYGEMFDVDMPHIKNLEENVKDFHGFSEVSYDIIFKGICPACRAKNKI